MAPRREGPRQAGHPGRPEALARTLEEREGTKTGGAGGWVDQCPYAAANFACDAACDNLQAIAAKCKDDPSIPTDIRAILEAVAAGTGNACKIKCAADSPTYGTQWSCFQAVPVAADCTAIAGCTLSNCPANY